MRRLRQAMCAGVAAAVVLLGCSCGVTTQVEPVRIDDTVIGPPPTPTVTVVPEGDPLDVVPGGEPPSPVPAPTIVRPSPAGG